MHVSLDDDKHVVIIVTSEGVDHIVVKTVHGFLEQKWDAIFVLIYLFTQEGIFQILFSKNSLFAYFIEHPDREIRNWLIVAHQRL